LKLTLCPPANAPRHQRPFNHHPTNHAAGATPPTIAPAARGNDQLSRVVMEFSSGWLFSAE